MNKGFRKSNQNNSYIFLAIKKTHRKIVEFGQK